LRRLTAYLLAAIGVLPVMLAIRVLSAGLLTVAIWLVCITAACWVAAFKIDQTK
jgi:hypothetical protein